MKIILRLTRGRAAVRLKVRTTPGLRRRVMELLADNRQAEAFYLLQCRAEVEQVDSGANETEGAGELVLTEPENDCGKKVHSGC